jgi:hypothetical protein
MPALALRSRAPARSRSAPDPNRDPRFKQVIDKLNRGATEVRKHPAAAKKAAEAGAAAKGPPNEGAAGAKAKQVDKIKEAPTAKPESTSFLALLRSEIDKAMPKTLGDTEKFMKGGDAGQLKSSLKGNVSQQTDKSAGGVESASKEAPKEGGVPTKAAQAIPGEAVPPAPAVDGAEAMPAPKPDSEVSLQASKADSGQAMKEAEVTPDQLKKANDPRFSAVLTAKDAVAKQADAAPGKFRTGEGAILGSAKAKAGAEAKKGAAAMLGVKAGSKSAVLARQEAAKVKEEAARKEVADHIEGIYSQTKTKVEEKLNGLETEVGGIFDSGVDAAINAMKKYVDDKLFDYKVKRYLSIPLLGLAAWVRDQFMGLPNEVNAFYTAGRALFTQMMDALVVRVANVVETRLREAKAIVAAGQAEIATYVAGLPKNLQAVGQAAQKEVAGRFDELERGIDDKKNQLAQQLAEKYKDAFAKADEALKAIQDENKGLVDSFMEKLGEVIKILTEFKAKLMALLKKGEDAIKMVLADPIGFLSNLLAAIKQGFNQFASNILTHLKKGFMTWLFGTLSEAGIEIPSDLTLPSILKLVMSVLGLTYERMRAEAVKLLGPTAVAIIEKLVDYIKIAIQGGPKALWEKVKEDLNSLKAMVIDAIQDWLITTIVKKAVAKIVTMFNPAGAIVQAVMMIYSVVTFIIERAAQIMSLVEAIINSVQAIAQGAISGAASWIEQALARLIPVAIGLLASLIGLGGIGAKIRELVTKAGDLVWGAIRKFFKKAIDFVKKMWGKLTGKKDEESKSATVKAKVAAELAGKKLKDAEEEKGLIASVYGKYKTEGLKGICFKPAKRGTLDVIVSASLAEKVAQLDLSTPEGLKELSRIAGMMSPYAGRTTIVVYYGASHKQFKTIKNKPGRGHAEHWLRAEVPSLMSRIRREYNTQQIALKDPVPIHLDINRTPCEGCAESHLKKVIDEAKSGYPDVKFTLTISSASVSEKGAQLTTERGLMALMERNVELTTSTVWTEIKKQMQANGIKQIEYRKQHFDIDDINEFIAHAADVQQLIDKTVTSIKKSKPAPAVEGSGAS